LLGRFGKAQIALPGGCQIGARNMDMHFSALEALGASFEIERGEIKATTLSGRLKGAEARLNFASVGATENLLMAATKAKGVTVIHNAAREPEIVDLANFLSEMGANISGAGTPVITIEGVDCLKPAVLHRTVGDRIEAGTFLVAGALCEGPLTVVGASPEHLELPLVKLREFGADLQCEENSITISHSGDFYPADLQTLPYPGFPTDLQAQFMVLCAIAKGNSIVTENLFENRFMIANEAIRMGANIVLDGHHALVQGVKQLYGVPVTAPDLRAGAGLLLAGLVANGETTIFDIEHINRGYERIVERLAEVGASIRYGSQPDN
jgi:UDP-N-acetylglucosamine 1-carboxyvinyltransferase